MTSMLVLVLVAAAGDSTADCPVVLLLPSSEEALIEKLSTIKLIVVKLSLKIFKNEIFKFTLQTLFLFASFLFTNF